MGENPCSLFDIYHPNQINQGAPYPWAKVKDPSDLV